MPLRTVAALALLATPCLAACEPERVVSCQCGPRAWPREQVEGSFVHSIEAIDVIEGAYTPPALPSPRAALALTSEDFFVWLLDAGAVHVVLRIHSWVAVEAAPGQRSCCGSEWDDVRLASTPLPWSARNRIALDPSRELGDVMVSLDPTLAHVEPIVSERETSPLAFDDDGRGLVLRTYYVVTPEGCTDTSCSATVRLTHHLRRPE